MKIVECGPVQLFDREPATESFLDQVLHGLAKPEKTLPSKFFYDARGSELYEQITKLPEYYLTRTELQIVREHAHSMAEVLGPRLRLVEFGSGSSEKTRILLENLCDPAGYVPIDISREYLVASAARIQTEMPHLVVQPLCADFTQPLELPPEIAPSRRTVAYFPGSTIGNLEHDAAQVFLRMVAEMVGEGGALVLGADVFPSLGTSSKPKTAEDLLLAYDDPGGVTAEFNLNLLRRMGRELGAEIDVRAFHHEAVFNRAAGRMESYLVSDEDQQVSIGRNVFGLRAGERILTEYSYKYGEAVSITEMAQTAGFLSGSTRRYTDAAGWFAVYLFER